MFLASKPLSSRSLEGLLLCSTGLGESFRALAGLSELH